MRRQAGATLIEVMISMSLLAVGMLGMIGGLANASRTDRIGRSRMMAMGLARDLAAHLETLPFDSPLLLNTSAGNDLGDAHSNPVLPGGTALADSFVAAPDHTNSELAGTYSGATDTRLNALQDANGAAFAAYGFRAYWNVAPPAAAEGANSALKYLTVIVTYSDGLGGRGSLALHTAVYDKARFAASMGAQ